MTTNFTLKGKTVFLTYPQCSTPKESLLDHLKQLLEHKDIKYATVGQEQHEDGNPHLHAFVWLNKEIHVRDRAFFDFEGHHPNIQSARNKADVIKYCQKDGNFCEYGTKPGKRKWDEVLTAPTRLEAEDVIRGISPRDWVLAYDRIQKYLDAAYPPAKPPYRSEYEFDATSIPSGVRSWLAQRNDRRPRSLVLIGPSRTGKTELARSLGHHIYWNGYYNLDKYDETAEFAIFDDIPWDRFHYMAKQWLGAQKEFETTDKYRRKMTIVWGKPSIYVSNDDPRLHKDMTDDMRNWLQENVIYQIINDKLY